MGFLVKGQWQDGWYDTQSHAGKFVRESPGFRGWIERNRHARFTPETGRYHLYVSYACPWACRTILARRLKGLEHIIGMSIVDPRNGKNGWEFSDADGVDRDPLYGANYLYQLYQKANHDYSGRVTTPTLWDKQHETIVSNESSDILRMFNQAFDEIAAHPEIDLCPEGVRSEIDALNERIYPTLNNGVYRAGFATTQEAYEEAYADVFETLDWLELRLTTQRYLAGRTITEADWRLFVTLVRFDTVYYSHFKCNRQRISNFPALHGYLRELYQQPGVAGTVRFDHIKRHYYGGMLAVNPTGIIPRGPTLSLDIPHGRDHLT